MAQYTMHFKLIEDTWSYLEEKDLRTVGDIEQTLSTGVTEDNQPLKLSKISPQVYSFLEGNKLNQNEKLRLVLTMCIALELAEKDRKALT